MEPFADRRTNGGRLSGIIKGSPTSCCSVGSRKRVVRSLCNVARGWVVSCVITIKRLRELAGKFRPMAVRLQLGAPLMPRLTHC